MSDKRLALVGYPPRHLLPFARYLEEDGFIIYWITKVRSELQYLKKMGVKGERILDATLARSAPEDITQCYRRLAKIERPDAPRIRDIILMDRMLRRKSTDFAIRYLGHIEDVVTRFLVDHKVSIVSSGRDTALQILSMLICRELGVTWVVPTRTRLPKGRYGFCSSQDSRTLLPFRRVTADDMAFAGKFLGEFRSSGLRADFKKSAGSLKDVLSLLPIHVRLFWEALKSSVVDYGNDYSRYTIPRLIGMYLRRKLNLLQIKVSNLYDEIGVRPYFLYALHTQPESSIDVVGSYFSDQLALINQIARSTPATHDLYVKVHQSDIDGRPLSFYRTLKRIPGVKLIGPYVDSRALIEKADLIFTVTGTIAYEAGLLRKPAITFANNYFNVLPSVHYCDGQRHLSDLITMIMTRQEDRTDDARIVQFLASLHAASFQGEVNRIHVPLTRSDLDQLVIAYNAVFREYSGVRRVLDPAGV